MRNKVLYSVVFGLSMAFSVSSAVKIMPIGDSITEGLHDWLTYRYFLYGLLKEHGMNFDFVGSKSRGGSAGWDKDHQGDWGNSAHEMIPIIKKNAPKYAPDVALIHLGVNDVWDKRSTKQILASLGEIVGLLRDANPAVSCLVGHVSCGEGGPGLASLIAALPKWCDTVSTSRSRVVFVPFTGFTPSAHTRDNNHPNEAGSELMAQRWFTALKGLQKPVSSLSGSTGRRSILKMDSRRIEVNFGTVDGVAFSHRLSINTGTATYSILGGRLDSHGNR